MNERSILYALMPAGSGWMSEGLASYATRLAKAHCVGTSLLLNKVVNKGVKVTTTTLHSMNGMGHYAEHYSDRIAQLTGVDAVHGLTLRCIRDGFDAGAKGLIRPTRAWCPTCQEEMRNQGTVYDPLLWSIQCVDWCPKHNKGLAHKCAACERSQPFISDLPDLYHCRWCQTPLSRSDVEGSSTRDRDPRIWYAEAVGELVQKISAAPNDRVATRIPEMIGRFADYHFQGNVKALAMAIGLDPDRLRSWKRGRYRPRFDLVIDVCYRLNKSPWEFIQDTGVLTHPDDWRLCARPTARQVRKRTDEDHKRAQEYLEKIIAESPTPLPSVTAICEELNCAPGYLNYRFPEQKLLLSALSKQSSAEQSAQAHEAKKDRILSVIQQLWQEGIYPSYNALARRLPRGWMKQKELSEYRKNVLAGLPGKTE